MDSDSRREKPTAGATHSPEPHHPKLSTSDLFSSAKLVADATSSAMRGESDKVDKVKAASAAEDILHAASEYGNLGEKGLGGYVEKAENYLHQYHSSNPATTTTGSGHSATTEPTDSGHSPTTKPTDSGHADTTKPTHSSDGGNSGSGGYGEYFKMAEGLFKK